MKTLLTKTLASLSLMVALVAPASAVTITLNASDAFFLNQASEPKLADLLAGVLGSEAADFATTLYKNSAGSEEGTLKENYTVGYSILNSDKDPGGDATITWDGGFFANATYLMAKDGNMGTYIWDVSFWNGKDTLYIPNPWLAAQGKAKTYSHITIWGSVGEDNKVPDVGTTAILLGLGLIGLGIFRRQVK